MDQITSTRHQEDVFATFFKLSHYGWDLSPGVGGYPHALQLHGKHAGLVIRCGVTIFPNLFSTYSYSCACIFMPFFNPDNYV